VFYKVANESDFQKRFKEYESIPQHILAMIIEQKKISPQILKSYRDITGESMVKVKKECETYLSYLQAYEDFLEGKTVYTEY
jgi:hypothetical protein